jgi:hypothetical protein
MADENETLYTSGSLESQYSHVKNTKAKAELSVDQKYGMLLPNIASCKLYQVHVKSSGQ